MYVNDTVQKSVIFDVVKISHNFHSDRFQIDEMQIDIKIKTAYMQENQIQMTIK